MHLHFVFILVLLVLQVRSNSADSIKQLENWAASRHPDAEYYFANSEQADGWLTSSNYPYPHYGKAELDYIFLFRIGPADVDKLHSICLRFVRFDYAASPTNYPACTSASIGFHFAEVTSALVGNRLVTSIPEMSARYCEDGMLRSGDMQSNGSFTALNNGDRLNSVMPTNLFDAPVCFMFTVNGTKPVANVVRWRAVTMQLSAKESPISTQLNYGLMAQYSMRSIDSPTRDSVLSRNFEPTNVNCTKKCVTNNSPFFFEWSFSQSSFQCECVTRKCLPECPTSSASSSCESDDLQLVQCGGLVSNDAQTSAVTSSRQRAFAASSSPRCVPYTSMCDRIPDCADGTDEKLTICSPSSYTYTQLACDFSAFFCNYGAPNSPVTYSSVEDHTGSNANKRGSVSIETSFGTGRPVINLLKAHVLSSRFTRAVGNVMCVNFYFMIKATTSRASANKQAPRAVQFEPYLLVLSRTHQPTGPTLLFVASLLHSVFHSWQKASFELRLVNETSTQVEFNLVADSSAQLALFLDDIAEANGPCRMRDTLDCTFETGPCGWMAEPFNGFQRAVIAINLTDFVPAQSPQSSNETRPPSELTPNRVWIDHSNLILLEAYSSIFSLLQSQTAATGSFMRVSSTTSSSRSVTLRSMMLNSESRSRACFTMWTICVANPRGQIVTSINDSSSKDLVPCGRFRFALENAVGEHATLSPNEQELDLRQRFVMVKFAQRRLVAWQLRRAVVPPTFKIAAYRLVVDFTFAPDCAVGGGNGAYDCIVGVDDVQLIHAECNTIEVDPEMVPPSAPVRTCRKRLPLNMTGVNGSAAFNMSNATGWGDFCDDETFTVHQSGLDTVHVGALIALAVLLIFVVVSAVVYFWRKYNASDDDDDDDDQLDFGAMAHPDDKDDEVDSDADDDADGEGHADAQNAADASEGQHDGSAAQRHDSAARAKRLDKSAVRRRGNEYLDEVNGCSSSTDDEYFYGMPADGAVDGRRTAQAKSKAKAARGGKGSAIARCNEAKHKDSMSSTDEKTSADRMLAASPGGATSAGVANNAARNNASSSARRSTGNGAANGNPSVRFGTTTVASNSNPYPNGNRVEVQVRAIPDDTTVPKEMNAANGRKQVYTTLALVERNPQAASTRTQLAMASNGSPHDRIWNADEAPGNDEYDLQNECTV